MGTGAYILSYGFARLAELTIEFRRETTRQPGYRVDFEIQRRDKSTPCPAGAYCCTQDYNKCAKWTTLVIPM